MASVLKISQQFGRSSTSFLQTSFLCPPLQKYLPWERTFDNLKKYPEGMPGGCWHLELTDALNEAVNCLYSFHGYDVISLTCAEDGSKQCENWDDVIPMR